VVGPLVAKPLELVPERGGRDSAPPTSPLKGCYATSVGDALCLCRSHRTHRGRSAHSGMPIG
jgi:hypothetical protein